MQSYGYMLNAMIFYCVQYHFIDTFHIAKVKKFRILSLG